ncbi:monofunctional biosynthetic peptidoglycan transglycosylase [Thalassobaculum salexigens]|uniref:monofunctional biosynthetic peptidoglycan transglycosylase n=1 Tax=Thalassobaculum salexigens TaxID=455360 RepID=UPI00041A4A5C|nr:monofunctional biosynthetic peptidoglycan transglycosylase [Thalassobaculum salexigens]
MARLIRRILLAMLVVFVVLPVLVILLYRVVPPPGTPLMLWREASADFRWVPMSEMSANAARAVVVSEDQTFCAHNGIDWRQMNKVLDEFRETGRPSRGASTITMQLARNLYLPPSRSILRKAVEIPLALGLELLVPKRRILELYLNVVEMGDGIYGVEAAAQRHFGKPASGLTRTEAARLAAILPNPLDRNPARPSGEVGRRAQEIARDIPRLTHLFSCFET